MTPIVEKAEKGLDFQIYSALKVFKDKFKLLVFKFLSLFYSPNVIVSLKKDC